MVFFFVKLCSVDMLFGFEMKLIGEVMGKDVMFEKVFYKGFVVSGIMMYDYGIVFLIVVDCDKEEVVELVKWFNCIGFIIMVIKGIVSMLEEVNIFVF